MRKLTKKQVIKKKAFFEKLAIFGMVKKLRNTMKKSKN